MMSIERLTEEEFQTAMNAINEIREEKARQEKENARWGYYDDGWTHRYWTNQNAIKKEV